MALQLAAGALGDESIHWALLGGVVVEALYVQVAHDKSSPAFLNEPLNPCLYITPGKLFPPKLTKWRAVMESKLQSANQIN